MRAHYVPNRGFNLDYIMWLTTRVTGLGTILLALIGLGSAMYMGARLQMDLQTVLRWTFFPNPYHVVDSNIPDVTVGWASVTWQVMQYLLLAFTFTHAANGIRMIVEDYTGTSNWRPYIRALIALVWVGMMVVGVYVIIGSAY